MVKSNIKKLTSLEGVQVIADFLGISQTTVSAWRTRGYASLKFIEKLGTYEDSELTEQDFIKDYENGIKRK